MRRVAFLGLKAHADLNKLGLECLRRKCWGETSPNTTINSHKDKRSEDSSDIHTASVAATPMTLIRGRYHQEALYTLKSRGLLRAIKGKRK